MHGISRGVLLNNPMNLRISANPWANKVVPSTDKEFEQFRTPYDGIRAGTKLIVQYHRLHGLQTVAGIISRYAPPTENNTTAYVAAVCASLDVGADDPIDILNPEILEQLVCAIIEHEQGDQPFEPAFIAEVVSDVLKAYSIN